MNNEIKINVTDQFGSTKQLATKEICKEVGMTEEEFYDAVNDLIKNKFLIERDDGTYDFYKLPHVE